jgi:hypothetical protein
MLFHPISETSDRINFELLGCKDQNLKVAQIIHVLIAQDSHFDF